MAVDGPTWMGRQGGPHRAAILGGGDQPRRPGRFAPPFFEMSMARSPIARRQHVEDERQSMSAPGQLVCSR